MHKSLQAARLQWKARRPDAGGARTWNGKRELKPGRGLQLTAHYILWLLCQLGKLYRIYFPPFG